MQTSQSKYDVLWKHSPRPTQLCDLWLLPPINAELSSCNRSCSARPRIFTICPLHKKFATPYDSAGEDSWESIGLQGDQKLVNPRGNQPWIFTGRTGAEAEAPILWPPDVKSWLTGKDPDARKDWRQAEKGTTEDETVGWHHQLNGHEFEQTLGNTAGQGSLACCSPWGHRVRHNWANEHTHFRKEKLAEQTKFVKYTVFQHFFHFLVEKCFWTESGKVVFCVGNFVTNYTTR